MATLLGILHDAQLTGHWSRMKGCRQCGYAFFDRSKNRSAARVLPAPPYIREMSVRRVFAAAAFGFAAILPLFFGAGSTAMENMVLAAAYMIMALGLKVVVGFAGLLDLGYVGDLVRHLRLPAGHHEAPATEGLVPDLDRVGTASRTTGRRETSLRVPMQVATVHRMPPHPPSPQVVSLIDRIKKLVAEQRRLDERDDDDRRRDSNRREIGRLKWRLANAVKRELSTGPGLRPALAFRL